MQRFKSHTPPRRYAERGAPTRSQAAYDAVEAVSEETTEVKKATRHRASNQINTATASGHTCSSARPAWLLLDAASAPARSLERRSQCAVTCTQATDTYCTPRFALRVASGAVDAAGPLNCRVDAEQRCGLHIAHVACALLRQAVVVFGVNKPLTTALCQHQHASRAHAHTRHSRRQRRTPQQDKPWRGGEVGSPLRAAAHNRSMRTSAQTPPTTVTTSPAELHAIVAPRPVRAATLLSAAHCAPRSHQPLACELHYPARPPLDASHRRAPAPLAVCCQLTLSRLCA